MLHPIGFRSQFSPVAINLLPRTFIGISHFIRLLIIFLFRVQVKIPTHLKLLLLLLLLERFLRYPPLAPPIPSPRPMPYNPADLGE